MVRRVLVLVLGPCWLGAVSAATAATPLPAVPATAAEVCIVLEGWDATVTPEEVRTALALRLRERPVALCATAPRDGCRVSLGAGAGGARTLRVACGPAGEPLSEAVDEVPAGPPEETVRWVAVEAAALLGAAALAAPRAAALPGAAALAAAPPRSPGDTVPAARDDEVPLADAHEPPAPLAPAPPPLPRPRVTASLGGGTAVAPELPGATYAFLLTAHLFVWRDVHLVAGLKLAGAFVEPAGSERDTVSDRAFWLGAGYRAPFSAAFVDVAIAGQYVVPILDGQGDSARPVEESRASRFSVRGTVELGYRLSASLALVLAAAGSMSFVQRDHIAAGQDILELGTAILDVTLGLEVGFR